MSHDPKQIPIPEGFEEVSAGQFASEAQYQCGKCKTVLVSAHYASSRAAIGRTVEHCGEPAWWIRNVKRKEIHDCPFKSTVKAMDANRKFVKVEQLFCKGCGKPYAVKTPEGFTQLYAKVEGQTCCCKEVEA